MLPGHACLYCSFALLVFYHWRSFEIVTFPGQNVSQGFFFSFLLLSLYLLIISPEGENGVDGSACQEHLLCSVETQCSSLVFLYVSSQWTVLAISLSRSRTPARETASSKGNSKKWIIQINKNIIRYKVIVKGWQNARAVAITCSFLRPHVSLRFFTLQYSLIALGPGVSQPEWCE